MLLEVEVRVERSHPADEYNRRTQRPACIDIRRTSARSYMDEVVRLLVFRLADQRFALPVTAVERVVRAAEVTPLPGAPPIVLGAISVEGRVLPVVDVRRRVGLPGRDITPGDWFLLAHTARRTMILVVDESDGVVERTAADILPSARIAPGLELFPGVIELDDGLVLIKDLERFLSLDEEREIDNAMTHCRDVS